MIDTNLRPLTAIPNVGPAIARRLLRLGITSPADLRGEDPEDLFLRCSVLAGRPEDPCLLDTLRAAVDVANGGPPRPWWHYSRERKARAFLYQRSGVARETRASTSSAADPAPKRASRELGPADRLASTGRAGRRAT